MKPKIKKGSYIKSIYNKVDSRSDLWEVAKMGDGDSFLRNASTVSVMVPVNFLQWNGSKFSFKKEVLLKLSQRIMTGRMEQGIKGIPFGEHEKFRDQPCPGYATAFLVAPSIIATCSHNVIEDGKILDVSAWAFVFDFVSTEEQQTRTSFEPARIAFGKRIIACNCSYPFPDDQNGIPRNHEFFNSNGWNDFALIEICDSNGQPPFLLNQSREPVTILKSLKTVNSVYLIGHPSGLPMKVAFDAVVVENRDDKKYFLSDLDAFRGNSGSPVFDRYSHACVGILLFGNSDYDVIDNYKGEVGKKRVGVFHVNQNNSDLKAEMVQKIGEVTKVLEQSNVDLKIIEPVVQSPIPSNSDMPLPTGNPFIPSFGKKVVPDDEPKPKPSSSQKVKEKKKEKKKPKKPKKKPNKPKPAKKKPAKSKPPKKPDNIPKKKVYDSEDDLFDDKNFEGQKKAKIDYDSDSEESSFDF